MESVITFDKLFKGMLNPRAIMPRSNLINFRSIIGSADSSRLFFEAVFRNNFRFDYRYAIKKRRKGEGNRRGRREKKKTIEIVREK